MVSEENRLRAMTQSEKDDIEQMMRDNPFIADNIVLEVSKSILFASVVLLILMALFYLVGWSESIDGLITGWVITVIGSTWHTVKDWRNGRRIYLEEIDTGQVKESNYLVNKVKVGVCSEAEEIVYFLQLDDGRVFVLWDDREVTEAPLYPKGIIRHELRIVRSVIVDWALSITFTGELVGIESIFTLPDKEEDWPEDEAFCDVPWDQIERRYGDNS